MSTIWPALRRKVTSLYETRYRLELSDGDFLDIDTIGQQQKRALVLIHGLEGSSHSSYILGLAHLLNAHFKIIALNLRGCSDETNRSAGAYHSGRTGDLHEVISWLSQEKFEEIYLVGFSLGGNILLKYLGDQGNSISSRIKKAVAISVPVHLSSSSEVLARKENRIYLKRFLKTLRQKALVKVRQFPECGLSPEKIRTSKDFFSFDDSYTAPIHGFRGAADYYDRASSLSLLESIAIPTLLLNARNDPFLSTQCFPKVSNPNFTAIYPDFGGHVGFASDIWFKDGFYYEKVVKTFFLE